METSKIEVEVEEATGATLETVAITTLTYPLKPETSSKTRVVLLITMVPDSKEANQPTTGISIVATSRVTGSSKVDLEVVVMVEEVETTVEDSTITTKMAASTIITSGTTTSDWIENLGTQRNDDGHCDGNQLRERL